MAQPTRTGGGHNHDPYVSEKQVVEMQGMLEAYVELLRHKEPACRPKGKVLLLEDVRTIKDLYKKLSLIQTGHIVGGKCSDFQAYLKCVHDKEGEALLTERINRAKALRPYLNQHYGADGPDIYQFLQILLVPCEEKSSCEM